MTKTRPYLHIPPESCLALRVPVRRRVRAAVGLRSFEALLLDLSLTGCRLRCPDPVAVDRRVRIVLPAGFGGRLPLLVRGEVARAEPVRGEPKGVCDVALRFRELPPRVHARLYAVVGEALKPPPEPGERRRSRRRWFGRTVIARGARRPCVLLGHDLSNGGMRVDGARGLAPGDELQVALHSQAGDVPLVLQAQVLRVEDGSAGLAFVDLTPGQCIHLEKLVACLAASGDVPAVVSEILEPSPQLSDL